jgi:hypothetical protein
MKSFYTAFRCYYAAKKMVQETIVVINEKISQPVSGIINTGMTMA